MNAKQFADKLDGRQYLKEITKEEAQLAKELGFLVVFGRSDDLTELRGVLNGEIGCWEGGDLECEDLPEKIRAVWCPDNAAYSWGYETVMPHATFRIFEDEDLYCIGLVIDWNIVKAEDYWCERCINFDRDHTDFGGMAMCKLIGLQTYAECYGKNCIGFNVPPEEIVRRKKGKWLKSGNRKECSVCSYTYYSNGDDANFCAGCGADMRTKNGGA